MSDQIDTFSQLFDIPVTQESQGQAASSQVQIPKKSLSECLHVFSPKESSKEKRVRKKLRKKFLS